MKATEAKLLDFLKKSPQFVIPIYQRTYSWTERECRQLWEDILRAGQNDKVSAHFVGSIVYIQEGLYQATALSPLLVIDGQEVSWEQFGRMLMRFEGWQFRLEIRDRSEDV